MEETFNVILLGIIYKPEEKKILIGNGNLDPLSEIGWCFPGAKLKQGENLDKKLKEKIKEQTGYEVKNLGSLFVRTSKKDPTEFIVYFLCEIYSGEENPKNGITELKWINPKTEIEEYFTEKMNTRLKEYLESLG